MRVLKLLILLSLSAPVIHVTGNRAVLPQNDIMQGAHPPGVVLKKRSSKMSAQVLEISKHDGVAQGARTGSSGRRARLYRFPSRTEVAQAQVEATIQPPKSRFRMRLAIEVAIGLAVWLTWFLWQHLH